MHGPWTNKVTNVVGVIGPILFFAHSIFHVFSHAKWAGTVVGMYTCGIIKYHDESLYLNMCVYIHKHTYIYI